LIFFLVGGAAALVMLEDSRSHSKTYHSRQHPSRRVISPKQRSLPDNTQHSQETDIHTPGGIRILNPSNSAAVDLRLRPHGHSDQRLITHTRIFYVSFRQFTIIHKFLIYKATKLMSS